MRWFLSAFVFCAFVFLVLPVVFIVWVSFFDSVFLTFPPPSYTFKWFVAAAESPVFFNAFTVSLYVAAMSSMLSVCFGAVASIALVRYRFPGRELLNGLLLSPLVIPNIVLGIALYIFFIAIADRFSFDATASNVGIVIAHTMMVLPWSIRLIGANLLGQDVSIEEAASNLGAGKWTVFRRVTFPLMRGGVVAAGLFSFIISFENLELSLLIVSPGRTTLPIALMQYLEFDMDPTIAAVSTIQVVIIAAVLVVTDRFFKLSRIV
ncbi:ABC transporter permease [Sneathiella sp.]|uniref:ABC transporter permease n=1 Tax=Sneathiella sp. TaxID=1964365 RepID=UPI00262CBEEF|nr:ABC transporter permease [Sneathiella sp.]MDF2368582.1 ABC transporter permease [Sneathiella sp.]